MSGKKITVQCIRGRTSITKRQSATLDGLGLKKRHQTRELIDTPSVRGMVNAIPHLAKIVKEG